MLKQTFVDIETAKALRKCNFRELTYAFYDLEGNLQNADANDPSLKDWNAPKETRGRGARCYAAPTLSAVQDWLRIKRKFEVIMVKDSFFDKTSHYFCRITRLKDGLSRDTNLRNDYDKALLDGITLAVRLLSY